MNGFDFPSDKLLEPVMIPRVRAVDVLQWSAWGKSHKVLSSESALQDWLVLHAQIRSSSVL